MKNRVYLLTMLFALFLLQSNSIIAQDQDKAVARVNYSNPETWLLGYFELDDLLTPTHSDWYNTGFDN